MRIIITGSRRWINIKAILDVVQSELDKLPAGEKLIIRHGDNPRGADHLAHVVCTLLADRVIEEKRPANWKLGKKAGNLRNQEMLDEGGVDRVHAFPTEESVGTVDMMARAYEAQVEVINHGYPVTAEEIRERVELIRGFAS